MQVKIEKELAQQEVNEWLDYKRIKPNKREASEDAIEALVEAVQYGDLSIDEDKVMTHKLIFPLTNEQGEETVKELKYQPRVSTGAITQKTGAVKGKALDYNTIITAYVSALTDKPLALIERLDTEDRKISQAIVSFFL